MQTVDMRSSSAVDFKSFTGLANPELELRFFEDACLHKSPKGVQTEQSGVVAVLRIIRLAADLKMQGTCDGAW